MVAVGIVLCHFHGLEVFEAGFLGDFVLAFVGIVFQVAHVSDVTNIAHFVAEVFQISEDQVKSDGRTGMAEMGVAVDGGSADIHAHMRGVQGFERLLAARKAIVNI